MREVFLEQLLESMHRVQYPKLVRLRDVSERRADPNDVLFDPLKAAILHHRAGRTDEAYWLVFLFVHFGKNARGGWRYAREVYGRLGEGARWDWAATSADPSAFRTWLKDHTHDLMRKGVPGGFGNHRKYQSLQACLPRRGTGAAVETYVRWINPPRAHADLMNQALHRAGGDPRLAFDHLYSEMKVVAEFGRTARFDYLAMIGKLGFAPIEPGSTYMQNSTGPVDGARLLFSGNKYSAITAVVLDRWMVELEVYLGVGMQALEDAICNWQKSPRKIRSFRA
jgi:hypothetical protein